MTWGVMFWFCLFGCISFGVGMLCILQMFVSVGESRIIWSVSLSVMLAFAFGLLGMENVVNLSLSFG